MKSRIIALALIVLFLYPFLYPLTNASIDGHYLIPEPLTPEPVRTNEGAYEDDFSDVSEWVVEGDGGGTVESDGDQATFSMPATNFEDNFYRTIPTENLYLTYYEFNVTAFNHLNAEFRIYQSGTYHTICSISAIGLYNDTIYTELSAASRISFLLEAIMPDSGNMTIDYLNIVPLWSAAPFSETLDDDVLYYPDPQKYYAVDGWAEGYSEFTETNTWESTLDDDGTYWIVQDQYYVDMYLVFWVPEIGVGDKLEIGMEWRFTASSSDDCAIDYNTPNFDDHVTIYTESSTTDTGYDILSISHEIDAFSDFQNASGYVGIHITKHGSYTYALYADYVFIEIQKSSGYTESFTDVSDWTQSVGATWGTDTDEMWIDVPNDAAGDSYYSDSPSLPAGSYYWEMRGSANSSYGNPVSLSVHSTDGIGGSSSWLGNYYYVIGGRTNKGYFSVAHVIESVKLQLLVPVACGAGVKFKYDYLRISSADEMGWQHDGSTTEGVDTTDNGAGAIFSLSSDGDILNMTVTRPSGSIGQVILDIDLDNTATSAKMEYDYYPFFKSYFSVSTSGCSVGWDIETDGFRSDNTTTNSGWWTYRWNAKEFTTANAGNRIVWWANGFEVGDSFTILFDYGKLYSIANYDISQSSTTVDDYLYVSEGILYSNMDTGTITLDYDPTDLSFAGVHSWNKSTSYGTSELSFYSGSWSSYSSATQGDLMGGTLTDIRIRFSEDANIINIILYKTPPQWHSFTMEQILFDMPNWHIFTVEDIIFYIPIAVITISYIMMLGGLVMIPVSTILLVKGGRSEMSREKLFLFLIMFFMGWALFLGGIL